MAIEDPYWLDRNLGNELREYVDFLLGMADSLQGRRVPALPVGWFDGSAESLHRALSTPESPVYVRHEDRIPIGTMRQAVLVYHNHTPALLDEYIVRAKRPSRKGYMAKLRSQM